MEEEGTASPGPGLGQLLGRNYAQREPGEDQPSRQIVHCSFATQQYFTKPKLFDEGQALVNIIKSAAIE
jgi:hypothetical protein